MNLSERIAKLTAEQRALLDARLRKRLESPQPQVSQLEKRPSGEPCLLSFAQERLWFLEQLEGVSATYNIYAASRFGGDLRVSYLAQALTAIVGRHEVLRTTFPAVGDDQLPIQQIAAPAEFKLEVVDLTPRPATQLDSAVEEWVNEFARQPMYLAQGPLFRARLLRIAPDDHVLVVIMHHIISDGWSLDVFFRELATLYADFLGGRDNSLPPLNIQFADYSRWQRRNLQGAELKRHVDYWIHRLAGKLPVLELPTDFPRPPKQSYHGAVCERQIGIDLTEKVRHLSRDTESTLFMTVLAAFQALLHRYSGQMSIQVGSTVSNRDHIELEPLLGFFVNMLVLRADFSDDPTGRELIRQVREVTLGGLAHQALPFERIVRELKPDRSMGQTPLFQVALMFEEAGQRYLQLPGLTCVPIAVNTGTAKFDLTLFVAEKPAGLRFGLEYATDLFTSGTAARLLTHLECLLESLVADPTLRVSKLNLLPPAEKHLLLATWNQTAAEYPRDRTIHALFAEQVQHTPDGVAVEFARQRLTYRELDHRAEALAMALQQKGVREGDLIGLYVERSLEMIIGLLGILKAGGAYVPLDPAFPKDRLRFMVADAKMPVLVTLQRLISELPEHQAEVVCIDAIKHSGNFPTLPAGSADNLAYVIYTSGSTGRPKGVQISHRAVVNFLQSMRLEPGLTDQDVLLAITTLSFDIACLELLLPLTSGARVVVVPREIAVDGTELAGLLEATGATVMQATPGTWRLLLAAGWTGSSQLKILCGGEPLPPKLAAELLPRCAELWNMYGPTETTVWSTCTRVTNPDDIHIGRPIANTEIYILDAHLNPVPTGVAGELLIGGDGLARGYLNRPELTAEKFVSHPFKPAARLYRTGDLAKYRQDGNIVSLGRLDFQVKVRGYRIELGEIEAALVAAEGVREAAVALRDEQLVAYLVPVNLAGDRAIHVATLRERLRERLPEYMVPGRFLVLERLPLTPNGKVDRKALPTPSGQTDVASASAFAAPRTNLEARLTTIWERVLHRSPIGIHDNFFDLGGHSMLAVKLFLEIENQLFQKLPLATLFNHGSVAALSQALEAASARSAYAWSSLVPIHPGGTRVPLYCIHGAGGNVLLYRELAARLGSDQPVYGFQSRGLDGCTRPLKTIEEMAQAYIEELRTVRPKGPYCLAGYCLGGLVAYQMARLLWRAGEAVPLLALLDTYNPAAAGEFSRIGALLQRARFHFGNLLQAGPWHLGSYVREKIRVARDGELANLLGLKKSRSNGHGQAFEQSTGASENHGAVQWLNDQAVNMFKPEPYEGSIVIFKPQVNYANMSDHQMGWGELARGGVEVVDLPVNPHAMLVEPFVEHLARALRQELDSI